MSNIIKLIYEERTNSKSNADPDLNDFIKKVLEKHKK